MVSGRYGHPDSSPQIRSEVLFDRCAQNFIDAQTPLMLPGGTKICRVCYGVWEDPENDGLCGCWQMETFMHFENGEGWVVKNESAAQIFHLRHSVKAG